MGISIIKIRRSHGRVIIMMGIHGKTVWRVPLLWRHNGRDGISDHQPHDCLLNHWFRKIKENIKAPRHWPLCGEFTGTGEFPAQMASNAEKWFHLMTSSCRVCFSTCVVYPIKHAFPINLWHHFTHIPHGCFIETVTIVLPPQPLWSNPWRMWVKSASA